MRAGIRWVGPVLKWLFDLQSRPGCSWVGHWGKALRWKWNTRTVAALAAGLVTHRHELVIRNVSAQEKVSGSGLLRFFSSFLNSLYSGQVAPACRVLPPCFIGTEFSVCVCVSSQLSVFTPQSRDPGSTLCMGDNVLRKLTPQQGLVQVLCLC